MEPMALVSIVLRWLHIVPAVIMAGGTAYLCIALTPALAELDDAARGRLMEAARRRWAKVVMICAALLLVSGLVNFFLTVRSHRFEGGLIERLYHPLFGVKFLLALVIFWIASRLVGRSEAAAAMRANAKFWLSLNLWLAIAVICLGGVLKQAQRVPKPAAAAQAPTSGALAHSDAPATPAAAAR